jgi:hypothetical protein
VATEKKREPGTGDRDAGRIKEVEKGDELCKLKGLKGKGKWYGGHQKRSR